MCVCVLWVRWCAKTGIHSHKLLLYLSNKNHNWLIIEEVFYSFFEVNWKWNWNKRNRNEFEQKAKKTRSKKEKNKHETQLQLNYILWVCLNTIHTHSLNQYVIRGMFLFTASKMTMHNYHNSTHKHKHRNSITRYANCSTKLAWLIFVCGFSLCYFLSFLHKIGNVFCSHTEIYILSLSLYLTNCHIS